MATLNDSTFREGQSTTRPPFFDDNDYAYWKTRMRIYLQALDYEIWEVVCDGLFLPLTKYEFGEDIPKPSREWNELEKRKASLNFKAMNALFCALDKKEFHRVSSCECANEIWHKLEVVYEEDLAAEKGHEEKKKSIALKASKYESDGESEPDDEELAMLVRRFIKFFKKTGERRNFRNFKNQREKKEVITCYECKKPGHIRSECPLINKFKKKAMVATWDDSEEDSSEILFVGNRCGNVYIIDIECASTLDKCFSALHDDSWLWHRRLGHASMDLISNISKNDLVKGLPRIGFQKDKICEACQFGKQIKTSFKNKNHISTSKPLELLHIDLFGPSRYASLNGKYYAFVIVDDYSRYTWVLFLANKDDALDAFKVLCKKLQNEKGHGIVCIRSDHGGEFENHAFEIFCNNLGIEHQFSSHRTPQQNGVVLRKNMSIQEMASVVQILMYSQAHESIVV
ncbi:Integrase catalytic domain-containing protein [Citrus sinensis]|nr:Integrase catalytic domain-containing protein [Citrus sinensis]